MVAIAIKLLRAALVCSIVLPGAGIACTNVPKAEVAAREAATNRAMLAALLQRRSEIARSAGPAEGKRHALEFLDKRIAQLRSRLGE